jgi:hypothetical protein
VRARLVAEFLGTGFLVGAVVGSGIMGERLAGGNVAIALLANTIATGAALVAVRRQPFILISDNYISPCFLKNIQQPSSCGKSGNPASFAGFPSLVGKSGFWTFPPSVFFHSPSAAALCEKEIGHSVPPVSTCC